MANPTDVLFQLQSKLNSSAVVKDIEVKSKEELDEEITNEFGLASNVVNRYDSNGTDVDDASAVDEPYVTHNAIPPTSSGRDNEVDPRIKVEQFFQEVGPEIPGEAGEPEMKSNTDMADDLPPEELTDKAGMTPGDEAGEMPPEGAEGMEGMPGEEGMGGMEGMGMEEETKSPSEIGRIYELKKIYTRLTTIESYLSDTSDTDLLRVRLLVSKSIELFEILSSNIPSYQPPKAPKETIDEIIVMYYKFLKQVYESVAKYYKDKQSKVMKTDSIQKANITLSKKELV